MAENTIITLTSPDGATLNTAGTYCEGNIEVVPKLQSKTATTGEVVKADDGYVGLESVDTNPAFEAGKKSEYDVFWDAAQEKGVRTDYQRAFASSIFNDANFKPKYDLICENRCDQMFMYSGISNIVESIERAGITLDFSRVTHLYQTFQRCITKEIGIVDCRSAVSLYGIFNGAQKLVRIHKMILKEEPYVQTESAFNTCLALESLEIEGPIVNTGFNFSWSPLNKASLTSIINALSSTTTGLTVTVRASAVKKAFETSEGANDGDASDEWLQLIATKPNWTINTIDS